MALCGHQLGNSDYSDWLMSSSAGAPVGGSTNTVQLLQSIILDESNCSFDEFKNDVFLQSQKMSLSVAREREMKYMKHREDRISKNRRNTNSFHDFSEFNEADHVDGCPVKWLYRRQSCDSWRSSSTYRKEEPKKSLESQKSGVRDKTPREIQIKKMGLKKRQGRTKNITVPNKHSSPKPIEETKKSKKADDERREKLAAKLNFKAFPADNDEEDSDDEIRISNFLQPRPLTGQRPWLCILLAPRIDSCCMTPPANIRKPETTRTPSISIRSLVLPVPNKPRPISTPLASSASRWAGRKKTRDVEKETRSFRTPPPLVIKLRSVEETKNEKSNNLIEEDRYYRLKRFFNIDVNDESDQNLIEIKKITPKNKIGNDSIQVVSKKIQFFERPGKPMR